MYYYRFGISDQEWARRLLSEIMDPEIDIEDYAHSEHVEILEHLITKGVNLTDLGVTKEQLDQVVKEKRVKKIQSLLRILERNSSDNSGIQDKVVMPILWDIWEIIGKGVDFQSIGINPEGLKSIRLRSYVENALFHLQQARTLFLNRTDAFGMIYNLQRFKEWALKAAGEIEDPPSDSEIADMHLQGARTLLAQARFSIAIGEIENGVSMIRTCLLEIQKSPRDIGSAKWEFWLLEQKVKIVRLFRKLLGLKSDYELVMAALGLIDNPLPSRNLYDYEAMVTAYEKKAGL